MTAIQVKPIEAPASFTKSNSGFGVDILPPQLKPLAVRAKVRYA
jgi:hypothetical protein